jgi:hypothetical protein
MPSYYSPQGNIEVWETMPDGYFTVEEWEAAHPAPEPEPPTEAELRERRAAEINAAVSARLNAFAAEKQYDDISAAQLAALSSEYAADGQTAQSAYDHTWAAAIAMWEDVASGAITVEQAVERLPVLTWPA